MDVVPFVPIEGVTMADCVALARDVAAEVGTRFALPVYLYEDAATDPSRRNLEDIRRGEFEGLAEKMARPGWAPDAGPAAPHPRAGATVIGARMPLIAYNINLASDRLDVARKIAAAVRHSSGGLRYVKAMGVMLEDRRVAQVSMNLTNYEKTPMPRVFEFVKREAARYGVGILESEIVGLVPQAALLAAAEYYLQIEGFSPSLVLENRLARWDLGIRTDWPSASLVAVDLRLFGLASWRDPERPHLAIEVAALHAEHFGGARHVAVLLGEGTENVLAFELVARVVQQHQRTGLGGTRGLGHRRAAIEKGEVTRRDRVAGCHDQEPLDQIAQLADVARPGIPLQQRHGIAGKALRPPAVLLARSPS